MISGCSAVWLARRSGGPEVADSNSAIPTIFPLYTLGCQASAVRLTYDGVADIPVASSLGRDVACDAH